MKMRTEKDFENSLEYWRDLAKMLKPHVKAQAEEIAQLKAQLTASNINNDILKAETKELKAQLELSRPIDLLHRIEEYRSDNENLRDQVVKLKARVEGLREALQKIKDGGVPFGVLANPIERMLNTCNIASDALEKFK